MESATGAGWQFTGPPPAASIVNYGSINADAGGFVYLIGANINNQGSINAPSGNIGLCAGQTVLISERADGRGLSAQVTLPTGSVNNSGQLVADAGTILASAQVVNQNGLIEANSVQNVGGIIELDASGSLTLGANSQITANGDNSAAGSSGGQIMLQTAGTYSDTAGSRVEFKGGANGGNGGRVLIYAASVRRQIHAGRHRAIRLHRRQQILLSPRRQSHAHRQFARAVRRVSINPVPSVRQHHARRRHHLGFDRQHGRHFAA